MWNPTDRRAIRRIFRGSRWGWRLWKNRKKHCDRMICSNKCDQNENGGRLRLLRFITALTYLNSPLNTAVIPLNGGAGFPTKKCLEKNAKLPINRSIKQTEDAVEWSYLDQSINQSTCQSIYRYINQESINLSIYPSKDRMANFQKDRNRSFVLCALLPCSECSQTRCPAARGIFKRQIPINQSQTSNADQPG